MQSAESCNAASCTQSAMASRQSCSVMWVEPECCFPLVETLQRSSAIYSAMRRCLLGCFTFPLQLPTVRNINGTMNAALQLIHKLNWTITLGWEYYCNVCSLFRAHKRCHVICCLLIFTDLHQLPVPCRHVMKVVYSWWNRQVCDCLAGMSALRCSHSGSYQRGKSCSCNFSQAVCLPYWYKT
jgi:hypothetical protein